MEPLSAILGIGSVLGSVGSTIGSIHSANVQNEEARRQFDASLAWSKYQYNDMKQYNSPKNQLRLMREAGLNPALALGQLPSSAAVGSSSPGATASYNHLLYSILIENFVFHIGQQYLLLIEVH